MALIDDTEITTHMYSADEIASAGLTPDRLLAMYRTMVAIRRFDERCLQLLANDEIRGGVHPYFGQEAVATGVCAALDAGDRITSTHRGHGHTIAKGGQLNRMMAELFGRYDGYCRGLGGSMHIADFDIGMLGANGIVGAGIPIAAGSALAAKLDGGDVVSVCFFSDGAVGGGPFHETLNYAALWQLPMVFVCENNGWASGNTVHDVMAAPSIAAFAGPHGTPAVQLDGNDVVAVYRGACEAVARARARHGPTLIEAMTYRMGVHVVSPRMPIAVVASPDQAALRAQWAARDPIIACQQALTTLGALDAAGAVSIAAEVDKALDDAVAYAQASPYPEPEFARRALFADW